MTVDPSAVRRDLEALRAWFNRWPGSAAMWSTCERIEPGRAVVRMDPPRALANPNGAIHGGVLTALADQAAGLAVSSLTTPEEYSSTVQLDVQFLCPVRATPLVAVGEVRRRGRALAFATAEVRDAEGVLCATAAGTWSVAETEHRYG